jgi:hypothetical protein
MDIFRKSLETMSKNLGKQTPVAGGGSSSRNFPQRQWAKLKISSAESGISVPELFRLAVSGEVKAVYRCKPGKSRGTWLINCQSLEQYIESFGPGGSRHRPAPDRIRRRAAQPKEVTRG